MGVTVVVVVFALVAGVVGFAVSAARAITLDPQGPGERHPRIGRFLRERFDRDRRRGFVLTVAFAITFVVAVVLGALLDMVDSGSGLAALDAGVARWGSDHASSRAVDVLQAVTQLGGTPVVSAALIVTGVVAWRRHRDLEIPLLLVVVGLGQLVLVNVLKVVVGRDRPDVLQLVTVRGPSFPSGHSCAAAACWAAVAFVVGHDASRTTRAALASAAVVVAIAVASSRALLGVHWLTDVIGGLALGWGWFALVVLAFRTRERTVSARPAVPRT